MGAFSSDVSRAEALLRAADALLQALGSGEVILILPVGDASLGPASATSEELPLSPAVVRNVGGSTATRLRLEVMLSACTVKEQAESRNFDPPKALFAAALGILYDGKLWQIESVTCESFAGAPYLYRILLIG
jgi:hypothetical protein